MLSINELFIIPFYLRKAEGWNNNASTNETARGYFVNWEIQEMILWKNKQTYDKYNCNKKEIKFEIREYSVICVENDLLFCKLCLIPQSLDMRKNSCCFSAESKVLIVYRETEKIIREKKRERKNFHVP